MHVNGRMKMECGPPGISSPAKISARTVCQFGSSRIMEKYEIEPFKKGSESERGYKNSEDKAFLHSSPKNVQFSVVSCSTIQVIGSRITRNRYVFLAQET